MRQKYKVKSVHFKIHVPDKYKCTIKCIALQSFLFFSNLCKYKTTLFAGKWNLAWNEYNHNWYHKQIFATCYKIGKLQNADARLSTLRNAVVLIIELYKKEESIRPA